LENIGWICRLHHRSDLGFKSFVFEYGNLDGDIWMAAMYTSAILARELSDRPQPGYATM
jgi:hypothetical protein